MLEIIRNSMAERQIDWLIIFSDDPHLSEYTSACDKYREAISGFTGSAGTLVITMDEAFMWTDMRYHIQASKQLEGTGITLMKYGMPKVPSLEDFLCDHIWDGMTLAFDMKTVSYAWFRDIQKKLPSTVDIVDAESILPECVNTGTRVFSGIIAVPDDALGKSCQDKLAHIRNTIGKRYINDESYTYILSDLTSQMWLWGLRGSDIAHVPVAYTYSIIGKYDAVLYISRKNLTSEAEKRLSEAGVRIKEYSLFYSDLEDIVTDVVVADANTNNSRILSEFDKEGVLCECDDNTLITKAIKNEVEIKGSRNAHLKDAVTMIRFIRRIKEMSSQNKLTDEYSIGEMLDSMRIENGCDMLSFDTICAYAENAAIVHYTATKESSKKVSSKGLLLVDSGGQYRFEGTTDITRTIALGPVTEDERKAYTTVLAGNLRLMDLIFPQGYEGTLLDAIAEEPLWSNGYYCGHGIGHGVGSYLSVHESGARISRRSTVGEIAFAPGVIVSDEPGVYLEGKFGVRLENLLLVTDAGECEGHRMCRFEPLTLVPFDRDCIDMELLSEKEKNALKYYNRLILERVGPMLLPEELEWLKEIIDIK